jgi:hypothetical protein
LGHDCVQKFNHRFIVNFNVLFDWNRELDKNFDFYRNVEFDRILEFDEHCEPEHLQRHSGEILGILKWPRRRVTIGRYGVATHPWW